VLPALSEFLRLHWEPRRAQIASAKAHLARLSDQLEARVTEEQLPQGLGRLTLSLLDGEVCDWHRCQHRQPRAVTPAVVPANPPAGPTCARGALTGMATNTSGCCWSRPSGGSCATHRASTPEPNSSPAGPPARRTQENRHCSGPPTGHRPVALAYRPLFPGRPGPLGPGLTFKLQPTLEPKPHSSNWAAGGPAARRWSWTAPACPAVRGGVGPRRLPVEKHIWDDSLRVCSNRRWCGGIRARTLMEARPTKPLLGKRKSFGDRSKKPTVTKPRSPHRCRAGRAFASAVARWSYTPENLE
jgi:hypothetical protein